MKRVLFFILAVALFVSCEKNELCNTIVEVAGDQFTATIEQLDGSGDTKTTLSAQNTVLWSENDELAIFQGATLADKYRVKQGTAGTSNGVFSVVPGESGSINGDFMSGTEVPVNIAVYPYENDLEISGVVAAQEGANASYTISNITIPSEQVYVANSFAQESFPMVAVTSSISDHALKFRNVFGAVKLQLLGNCTVKSIKLEGNKGEILAGDAKVTAFGGDGIPEITMLEGGSTSIVLDCGNGVQLNNETATEFIIALPPTNFEEGFTVTITDTDDCAIEISTTSQNEVLRSHILKMPERNIFESGYIKFHDELVKELCIDAFDTNDDGELSYEEAAAVTSLSGIFSGSEIKSFDELRYFTSLTSIYIFEFNQCKLLESVIIPDNVTSIKEFAFRGCEMLNKVTLPSGVKSIGWNAFAYCTSLVSITLPEQLNELGISSFYGCSSLESITLPEGLTSTGNDAFASCSSLATVNLPSSLKSIESSTFQDCSSLKSIVLPENLTFIGGSTFKGCSALEEITIPSGVTSINYDTFRDCISLTSVTLHDKITSIREYAFSNCSKLTTIDLPNDLISIDRRAFQHCTLLSGIDLPEGVTTLGEYVFSYCTSLTSIILPQNMAVIDMGAFWGCSSLESCIIKSPQLTTYGSSVFAWCDSFTNIYVPASSVDTYKTSWPDYADKIKAIQ